MKKNELEHFEEKVLPLAKILANKEAEIKMKSKEIYFLKNAVRDLFHELQKEKRKNL